MAAVPSVLAYAEEQTDLDVIAITEHDTLRAADEARDMHARGSYRFSLVTGEEVTTLDGHLLALFIDEPVASFRRIEETLAEIHGQGGIAIAPHPLSWLTRSITERTFDRVARIANDGVYFDAIEEYNMSPAGRVSSTRARRLNSERLGLAAVGSSDAHFLPSIGSARTSFEGATPADLRLAIESRSTVAVCGVAPRLSALGYRNIVLQQYRGLMATPRNKGWSSTIRSFVASRTQSRVAERADAPADPREGTR